MTALARSLAPRQTRQGGFQPGATATRRATFSARSYNAESRTVDAIFSAGSRVRRWGAMEELAISAEAIDLNRAVSGRMAFLFNHDQNRPIGVVEEARIESGRLVGRLRFSDTEEGRSFEGQVARGELSSISIGYRVTTWTLAGTENETEIWRAERWELLEVSLVSVPADAQAHVRSQKGLTAMDPDQIETETEVLEGSEAPQQRSQPTPQTRAERQRIQTISDLGRRAGLDQAAIDAAVNDGMPVDAFRTRAFDHMAGSAERSRTSGVSGESFDNPGFLERAIGDALFARMTGAAPEGAAREWAGRSLLEMGAALLQARGERVSWSSRERLATQIMTRSHTTSDFPILLSQSGNRVLQNAYKASQSPLKQLARRRNAPDFRSLSTVKLSEAPRLVKVGESGEVKHGSRSEEQESFKLETYARIFSISRNAIINDDLGAFAESNQAWGRAAAETEAELLVALFTANGGDGVTVGGSALYSTAHKNKAAAGAALTVEAVGAARQAMREMKGLDGQTPIGVAPKHLVVGPAKETEAEMLLAEIAAAQVSNANPFSRKLDLHVEPRFTGNAWRLFADPSELTTIEIAYLNGQEGPILDIQDGWTTLGAEFRAVLDFGCGITEWRGTYLNPGA